MSYVPAQELQTTAFGELSTAEATPEVQVSAVNGLRDDMQQLFAGAGSSVGATDGNYECVSGTDPAGISSLLSKREITYRPGQGLEARFTALFPTNQPNSIQLAGLINSNNIFSFGYNGTEFGIVRAYNGVVELQTLQVTTPAGGAENATITVNGTAYIVPLTSGTVQHNAFEISNSLNTQIPNYTFSSNNDTVTALAGIPIAAGSFAFTSGTAVAAWTQNATGVAATFDWVAQADWSETLPFALDPTKGNVYQIKMQYLGYGGIRFYVEDPETDSFVLAHNYQYANAHTVPSVGNPTFRIGWVAQNLGNTTPITVKGASAAGFTEGKKILDDRVRGLSNEIAGLGTTQVNLLTIRNRIDIGNNINRVSVYPKLLIASASHNKTVVLHINIGTVFSGDLDFSYLDVVNSSIEYATDQAPVLSSGREVATIRLRSTGPIPLNLSEMINILMPRETLTFTVSTSSGAGAECDVSITWQEDA